MATSIHTDAPNITNPEIQGIMPNTRIIPGELEKPIVRNNSPGVALVCCSGRSFVPIK